MERFKQSLEKLNKTFNLVNPIMLGRDLSCSIALKEPEPLVITFNFHENSELEIEIRASLAYNCPSQVLVMQAMMNHVVAELLSHNKLLGRLVFNPLEKKFENVLNFNNLEQFEEQAELILPLFIEKCHFWKSKFNCFLKPEFKLTPFKETEIVSFEKL